jgi:hypothetical protein
MGLATHPLVIKLAIQEFPSVAAPPELDRQVMQTALTILFSFTRLMDLASRGPR